MEIVVKRIAKKETYTIGRLYLLADGDVKRKALSGKTAGDKRSFEHSFDLEKLSKDSYFCDTLEPTWRNLKGVELSRGSECPLQQREWQGGTKDSGPYRHPPRLVSCAHHQVAPIQEVAAVCAGCSRFRGIRIHAGNKPEDTQSCILVGENRVKGMVVNSRIWLHRLMNRIQAAENQGEGIWITII